MRESPAPAQGPNDESFCPSPQERPAPPADRCSGAAAQSEEKACEVCGRTFKRKHRAGYEQWASQRACSRRCGVELSRKPRPDFDRTRHPDPTPEALDAQAGSTLLRLTDAIVDTLDALPGRIADDLARFPRRGGREVIEHAVGEVRAAVAAVIAPVLPQAAQHYTPPPARESHDPQASAQVAGYVPLVYHVRRMP